MKGPRMPIEQSGSTFPELVANWGEWKAEEHAEKGRRRATLDGIPTGLPGLLQAQRLGEKAAEVGFDWPDVKGVRDKVDEELRELDEALARDGGADKEHVT